MRMEIEVAPVVKPAVNSGSPPSGEVSSEDNHIYFYCDVTQKSCLDLVKAIRKIDTQSCIDACVDRRTPAAIELHIHSYGGSVYSALAVIDTILQCRSPVYTHIEGGAASAGTLISMVGDRRFMGANSFALIHQLSSVCWGKYEEMKDDMRNADQLMAHIVALYVKHTKMPQAELAEILKKDLWFNADKCLEIGLVDEILEGL